MESVASQRISLTVPGEGGRPLAAGWGLTVTAVQSRLVQTPRERCRLGAAGFAGITKTQGFAIGGL